MINEYQSEDHRRCDELVAAMPVVAEEAAA